MKRIFIAAAVLGLIALPGIVSAQNSKEEVEKIKEKNDKIKEEKEKIKKKETQEIIIRQKGDKDIKLKVEIDGDNVTVNGKPLSEFKDGDVTISKKKMTIHDGHGMSWDIAPEAWGYNFNEDFPGIWNEDEEEGTRAFLGVTTDADDNGAKIEEVVKGSAAEKAGLKKGDIITKIGDEKISGPDHLTDVIRGKKPKDEVKVFYKRDGKEVSAKAVLGEKKVKKTKSWSYSSPKGRAFVLPPNMEGMDVLENLDEIEAPALAYGDRFNMMFPRQKKIGLKLQDTEDGGGVKVINVEDSSAAAIAGLKKDDVITEIDGAKIDNTDDAREKLIPEDGKKGYEIKATRGGSPMTFQVKIPRKLKTANF